MKYLKISTLLVVIAAPAIASAQLQNIQTLIGSIGGLVSSLIPIAFAAGLLFFFWGLALYISAAGDEGKKSEGKNIMIWGIVALFIMASIWGIIAFIQSALDIDGGEGIEAPTVQGI